MPNTRRRTRWLSSARSRAALACVASGLALAALPGCHAGGRAGPDPADIRAQEEAARREALKLWREGLAFEQDDRPDRAIISYQKAIAAYRDIPMPWNNLGVLLMAKGGENHIAAANAFMTAAELAPADPVPYYNLGTLWEKTAHLDDAQKFYLRALDREPNHLPSLRRSILLDSLRGQGDEDTLERIRRAMVIESDPWWNERLRREEIRVQQQIENARASRY